MVTCVHFGVGPKDLVDSCGHVHRLKRGTNVEHFRWSRANQPSDLHFRGEKKR